MTFARWWTDESVRRYFPVEALTKPRDVFEATHIPIDRILVDPAHAGVPHDDLGSKRDATGRIFRELVTSESRLLGHLETSKPSDPNRIVLLTGETGSGKSELCQFLAYQLDSGSYHVPILIERSRTRLADIVSAIERHLGEQGPMPIELDHVSPEQFSARIKATLLEYVDAPTTAQLFGEDNVAPLRTILTLPDFETTLGELYLSYRDELSRPGGVRLPDLLPFEKFRNLAGIAYKTRNVMIKTPPNVRSGKAVEYIYSRFEPKVRDALAALLKIDNLLEMVRRLSDRFAAEDRRPVLLIEDITTFGFLQNDLLDYLFDLSSGHYDVVLGITTDFERRNQELGLGPLSTVGDRLDSRLMLTSDGRTLFAENSYLELALRHLNGVVCPPDNVPGWWTAFNGFYPFTPLTISRIWDGLQDGGVRKQTPRLLLRVMRDVLLSNQLPSEMLDAFVGSRVSKPPIDMMGGVSEVLSSTAQWYGWPAGDHVYVHTAILSAFRLDSERFPIQNDWALLPASPVTKARWRDNPVPPGMNDWGTISLPSEAEATSSIASAPVDSTAREPVVQRGQGQRIPLVSPTPQPSSSSTLLGQASEGMDGWLKGQRQFPRQEEFARAIISGIEYFGLPAFDLSRNGSIASEATPIQVIPVGQKESRVGFEGAGATSLGKVLIPRREEDRQMLESLLVIETEKHGWRSDAASVDSNEQPIIEIYEYLSTRSDEARRRAENHLMRALGCPVPVIAAFGKFLLLNGTGSLAVPEPIALSQSVAKDDLRLKIGPTASVDKAWHTLTHHVEVINGLFAAQFFLQGSFLDYPELEKAINQFRSQPDFDDLLEGVSKINVDLLLTRFEFKGRPVAEFQEYFVALRAYAKGLLQWSRLSPRPELIVADTCKWLDELTPTEDDLPTLRSHVDTIVLALKDEGTRIPYPVDKARDAIHEPSFASDLALARRGIEQVLGKSSSGHFASVISASRELRVVQEGRAITHLRELHQYTKSLKGAFKVRTDPASQGLQDLAISVERLAESLH